MISINPSKETRKIINFIQDLRRKTGLKDIVIGWSGGIDSTVCLYLLAKALPSKNIHVLHMPYGHSIINELTLRQSSGQANSRINGLNIHEVSIKKGVDILSQELQIVKLPFSATSPPEGAPPSHCTKSQLHNLEIQKCKVRLGNIMARVRMIMLFDFAKKVNGLVCGTENKSEHLLGYFTRYGDEASDIEPIQHLFKTQVYELARYLKVPESIINKKPSANLWEGQTDEGEFGFTYDEADEVLSEVRESKGVVREYKGTMRGDKGEIKKKIIERVKKNKFKREVPYTL